MAEEYPEALRLSELARAFQAVTDVDELLRDIVQAAVQMVPGTDEGSLTRLQGRRTVTHVAASGPLARQIDALMAEVGEGPCLDATFGERIVRVGDLASEHRWPTFSARALAVGARSMMAFPLFVEDDDLGALNLYSATPDAFTDESEHYGLTFAAHAAVAVAGAQHLDQLNAALTSRELIGQAVGILTERHSIDPTRAFATLVKFSQDTNRKLRDVAADVVRGVIARNTRP